MAKSTSDIDNLIKAAFDYAVSFYSTHSRSIDNQWACLAEMMRISGFDDKTCVRIQNPILSHIMY